MIIKNNNSSILVFEDDIDLVSQWMEILIENGYTVDCARKYKEALDYCNKTKYDLIVCDIFIKTENNRLDCFGGITLMQYLRFRAEGKMSWTKQVPVIIVTGSSLAKKDKNRYKDKYDAKTTLLKPFSPNILLEEIENILSPA